MAAELDPTGRRTGLHTSMGIATGSGIRIGDAERERAADALGAHFRAGRLDATEYDERVQAAFAVRTAAELTPLFADLPNGSPLTPSPPGPPFAPRSLGSRVVGPRSFQARRRRGPDVPRAVVLLLIVAAVIGFTAVAHFPPFFLIPLFWFGFGRRFGHRHHHGYAYSYGGARGRR